MAAKIRRITWLGTTAACFLFWIGVLMITFHAAFD